MITPAQAQPDTLALYGFLPQFVQDNDAAGGYQFLSWLDGFISEGSGQSTLTTSYTYGDGVVAQLPVPVTTPNNPIPAATGIQAIDDIVRDTAYNPGWSAILDVNRCPTYALPWLGQFVGVRINQITNREQMRQTILAENAFVRGTAAAIEAAANAYMQPGFFVTLQERTAFDGMTFTEDAYAITITFVVADVLNLTYGELFADYPDYAAVLTAFPLYENFGQGVVQLEAAVTAAAPAGLAVYFNPL